MAGLAAFGADRGGGSGFAAGGAAIPASGSVLGADYDLGDYAVLAGRGPYSFLAAFRGDGAWSGGGRDCGELLRAASLVFAASVFILGLLSALVPSDRSAYRFGGVTLAIVLMVPRTALAWQVAFHRFA